MVSVCVFCGSGSGKDPNYISAAMRIACHCCRQDIRIVYGGGSVGVMGAVADACLSSNASIIGVIPESLADIELMHPDVQDMRVVPDMHARKALMHQLSDAYLALPGGFGTMEELFEVLCWSQLDIHQSPIAVFNQNGFYDPLIALADAMVDQEFLSGTSRQLMTVLDCEDHVTAWLDNLVQPAAGATG